MQCNLLEFCTGPKMGVVTVAGGQMGREGEAPMGREAGRWGGGMVREGNREGGKVHLFICFVFCYWLCFCVFFCTQWICKRTICLEEYNLWHVFPFFVIVLLCLLLVFVIVLLCAQWICRRGICRPESNLQHMFSARNTKPFAVSPYL